MNIESQMRSQSKSEKWYEQIYIYTIFIINLKNCYRVKFRSIATDWGIEHENAAKECYFSIFSSSHENLTIRDSGLIINPNYPYIGASPDATV